MHIEALGYVGFESPNSKAWENFGPGNVLDGGPR
jgi:hypothetical protein